MSRAERLLDLIQLLREHRYPVTGTVLCTKLGVSLRTLYRDIKTLQEQGAHIEGEPGLGYLLRPGFILPPLMLTEEEIEALLLGSRWVAQRGDAKLGGAAQSALSKIIAVLPGELRDPRDTSTLLVGPGEPIATGSLELPLIRQAICAEHKLHITYRDLKEDESSRTIWPFAVGFFDDVRIVVAWCELRLCFRHFRVDRITSIKVSEQRYPRNRQSLLKEWRATEKIPVK
ncbi:helix-turn-helix transcriptional regulator [Solimicrobium silvestre]|uniref:Putative transcriptional regulator n=1 Tax=Solimicrobium silvestre TaxID=2099400 RepID=A0A2S9H446_9BURK|nr:YafY family protein [Solimicrobium silvestre]PRC94752.1 putative transcriptional regulator [Solimicrobium silvestre]